MDPRELHPQQTFPNIALIPPHADAELAAPGLLERSRSAFTQMLGNIPTRKIALGAAIATLGTVVVGAATEQLANPQPAAAAAAKKKHCDPKKPVSIKLVGPRIVTPNVAVNYDIQETACKTVHGVKTKFKSSVGNFAWKETLKRDVVKHHSVTVTFPDHPVSEYTKEFSQGILVEAFKGKKLLAYKSIRMPYVQGTAAGQEQPATTTPPTTPPVPTTPTPVETPPTTPQPAPLTPNEIAAAL